MVFCWLIVWSYYNDNVLSFCFIMWLEIQDSVWSWPEVPLPREWVTTQVRDGLSGALSLEEKNKINEEDPETEDIETLASKHIRNLYGREFDNFLRSYGYQRFQRVNTKEFEQNMEDFKMINRMSPNIIY